MPIEPHDATSAPEALNLPAPAHASLTARLWARPGTRFEPDRVVPFTCRHCGRPSNLHEPADAACLSLLGGWMRAPSLSVRRGRASASSAGRAREGPP